MRKIHGIAGTLLVLFAALCFGTGCGAGHEAHDTHEGHGDEAEAEGHEEHDEEHDDHEAEGGEHVELTAEQQERIGLTLAEAKPGSIGRELRFPGEIVLNPDRVAHVVPRAAGIVRQVEKTLGDTVEAGETLAWIESEELAQAKLDFYAREAEVGCCMVELPRAKAIFSNVNRLLDLLRKSPSMEALKELDGLEMGAYRGRLISAYAEYSAAEKAFDRERGLREKNISSEQDFIAARAQFQRARAEFNASLDTARYEVLVAFGEAARARQVAEFEAVAAEQRLRLKGVGEEEIEKLRGLVPRTAGLTPCLCGDPKCEDNEIPSVRGRLGADEKLGWFALRAPFAGVIIQKHLTLGEKVDGEESVFAVADTKTVWANFSVFQKDMAAIKSGQRVRVEHTGGTDYHTGTIDYVAPLLEPDTRTAKARVVLTNGTHIARPGLFVSVLVSLPDVEAEVVVPRSAVQVLDEKAVVFVAEGDGFTAVPVTLGRGDRDVVEVTSGLEAGQRYVLEGAFELKAKIATSGLGAHAGHGH